MHAEKAITKISRDYKKFARNMAIIKNSMDRATDIDNARREGITEGKAEGKTETSLEIARKMKKAGRPFSEIVEFTGIPKDIVEKL